MDNSFQTYVKKGLKLIYLIAISLTILVSLIDVFQLGTSIPSKFILNISTIGLLIISLILYLTRRVDLEKSYGILAYIIITSTICSFYFYRFHPHFLHIVLRDSLFLISVITISGFVLNRRHSLIYSIILLLNIAILSYISRDPFLLSNLPGILAVLIFYTTVFYYFLKVRDGYLRNMQDSNKLISDQHDEIVSSK